VAVPARGGAQDPVAGQPCAGTIVTDITIEARPPAIADLTRRWRLLRGLERLHVTSRAAMIRRFLIHEVGQPCVELRRAEAERILRAQPFLADATITATSDGAGGTRLHVVTIDEFSMVGALAVRSDEPYVTRLRIGDGNLLGSGMHVAGEWRDGLFYRDAWHGRITDYQLFGRPYQLTVEAGRRHLGEDWLIEASHPFLTDLQRAAWRLSAGEASGYFSFLRERAPAAAVEFRRSYADVGGIIRIGGVGRLSVFGASLSREREASGTLPVVISDSGIVPDTSQVLVGRYGIHETARINALWGVRNIRFRLASGFDALTAAQDIRHGFQLGVLAGRSLSVLGSTDDDIFVMADLYSGWTRGPVFVGLQILGEGRENYDENRWDGVVASGRAAAYLRVEPQHTFIASAEYSGGWRHRTPFALRLGGPDGGIRGYADSRVLGGQRGVVRLEDRWNWLTIGRAADIGFAIFADAGKMRAGEVPFGIDTPIRYGAGLGFLAAVPARSRRLWRLDIAAPLSDDTHAGWEVRLSSSDMTRVFWREPRDVARSRERFVPTSLFSWP
jgi:hypothetical protein